MLAKLTSACRQVFALQKVFNTLSEAAIFLNEERKQNSEIKGMTGHISQVCNGKRKTAYNHKWKWLN